MVSGETLPWRMRDALQRLLLLSFPMDLRCVWVWHFRIHILHTTWHPSQAHTFISGSTEATAIDFKTRGNTGCIGFLERYYVIFQHGPCWRDFQGYFWLSFVMTFFFFFWLYALIFECTCWVRFDSFKFTSLRIPWYAIPLTWWWFQKLYLQPRPLSLASDWHAQLSTEQLLLTHLKRNMPKSDHMIFIPFSKISSTVFPT